MPKKKSVPWRVFRLKASPATFIGTVYAPDEETARKVAIEQFRISPQYQKYLLILKA